MDKNDKQLLSLLQDSYFTKEEKNKIKKSKQAFDAGYLQACKQFKEQVATFDAQFVLLDWSSGTSYDDDKFLPRSFTLYTLVQRHLLQKEMQKNKIWWNYRYGRCNTFWGSRDVLQWFEPMSTLASIYQSVMCKILENKIYDTQGLLTENTDCHSKSRHCKKDVVYLQHLYSSLPPVHKL